MTLLQAVVLETDWKLSELSERILAGDEVSSELDQLEQVLSSTLTHSNVGVALRAELLIRLGQYLLACFRSHVKYFLSYCV